MDQIELTPHPYAYPVEPYHRRHGPMGYGDYKSYRSWLEDEFWFRCVYCLSRMVWAPTQTWVVDHLVSKRDAPERECEYENLVFACQFCNGQKGPNRVPDPCKIAYGKCLTVNTDGSVTAHGKDGERLIKVLRLNHPHLRTERQKTLRYLTALFRHDFAEFKRAMGFPDVLPDLRHKVAPSNNRPESANECFHVLREAGKLPNVYCMDSTRIVVVRVGWTHEPQ